MKPTILCVDDEPNVLDVLSRMFDRLAIVLTAKSGPEALEILRSRPVDLLITDQKMPDMTGIELVREARKEGLGVTTILLTAYTNPNDLISAINEGQVFRYVTKPWDLNDLTMTVRNALAVAQLRKEKERLVESLHKRVEALNVMYEVSRQSAKDAPSLDAIVDRLLATVGRVLPHDASAVLIESSDGQTAALRIRCTTAMNESALLHVKDSVLSAHRKAAGVVLPEEKVTTNVGGEIAGVAEGLRPSPARSPCRWSPRSRPWAPWRCFPRALIRTAPTTVSCSTCWSIRPPTPSPTCVRLSGKHGCASSRWSRRWATG